MRYGKRDTVKVEAVGHTVVSKSTIKYLEYPEYMCQYTAGATAIFATLLLKVGGPEYSRALLIAEVIWSDGSEGVQTF